MEGKNDDKKNEKSETKDIKEKNSIQEAKKDEENKQKNKTKDIKEKDSIQEEIPYSCIPRLEDNYKDLSYDR
jgi:flagellar biosynthesis component FlhA